MSKNKKEEMIIELLKPINEEEFNSLKSKKSGSIGEEIQIYTENLGFPDIDSTDIAIIGINSNDSTDYPEDSFDNMKKFYKKYHFSFPYLYDETQEIAKKYDASCTPDFYGFDKNKLLKYRGRIDGAGLEINNNAIRELFISMKAIVNNKKIPFNNPSIGCSIKWKKKYDH